MNLPESFDHKTHKPGFEWADRSRFTRLSEGLDSRPKHSIDEVKALQADFTSIHGRRVKAVITSLSSPHRRIQSALDLLDSWDAVLAPDSAGAALFEVWFAKHLSPQLIAAAA